MSCLASLCAKRNFHKTNKMKKMAELYKRHLFLQRSPESWLQAGSFQNGGTGWWWSVGLSSRSDDPRRSGPYGALCCWNHTSGSNGRCPELQIEKWKTGDTYFCGCRTSIILGTGDWLGDWFFITTWITVINCHSTDVWCVFKIDFR